MEAPEPTHDVRYIVSFYFPSEYQPDEEQIKQIIRNADELHPWDAGMTAEGEKRPSISDIEYEKHTSSTIMILEDGKRVPARIHTFVVKPGDSPMPLERVYEYNDDYLFWDHHSLLRQSEQLPTETIEVKINIWLSRME